MTEKSCRSIKMITRVNIRVCALYLTVCWGRAHAVVVSIAWILYGIIFKFSMKFRFHIFFAFSWQQLIFLLFRYSSSFFSARFFCSLLLVMVVMVVLVVFPCIFLVIRNPDVWNWFHLHANWVRLRENVVERNILLFELRRYQNGVWCIFVLSTLDILFEKLSGNQRNDVDSHKRTHTHTLSPHALIATAIVAAATTPKSHL